MRLSRIRRIKQIEEGVIYRGRRPRWITPSEICLILHILRKPNSLIALSFIQSNSQFKNIATTCLPASMLSSSQIVDSVRLGLSSFANILQIANVALRDVFLLFLLCVQLLSRLVAAVVLTLETSEIPTTQPRRQVFSVTVP